MSHLIFFNSNWWHYLLDSKIKVGNEHPEFGKICKKMGLIPNKGDKVSFVDDEKVDPAKLLPPSLDFWRYEGSLTTPPLLESVIWTVFKKPIQISQEQVLNYIYNISWQILLKSFLTHYFANKTFIFFRWTQCEIWSVIAKMLQFLKWWITTDHLAHLETESANKLK